VTLASFDIDGTLLLTPDRVAVRAISASSVNTLAQPASKRMPFASSSALHCGDIQDAQRQTGRARRERLPVLDGSKMSSVTCPARSSMSALTQCHSRQGAMINPGGGFAPCLEGRRCAARSVSFRM
jgi:hypothetical protein